MLDIDITFSSLRFKARLKFLLLLVNVEEGSCIICSRKFMRNQLTINAALHLLLVKLLSQIECLRSRIPIIHKLHLLSNEFDNYALLVIVLGIDSKRNVPHLRISILLS